MIFAPLDRSWPREKPWLLRAILGCSDRFAWALRAARIDYPAFRAILETKLVIDFRSSPFEKYGGAKVGYIAVLGLLALMGALQAGLAWLHEDLWTWMAQSQAIVLGMLVVFTCTQGADLLLDPSDLRIVLPRPVDGRTLIAARLAHLFVFFGAMALALSLCPSIAGVIRFSPWVLPLYPFCALLNAAWSVALTGLALVVALAIFGPERFQRISTWIQIVAMVVWIAAGQLGPMLSSSVEAAPSALHGSLFGWWVPPMQQAELVRACTAGEIAALARLAAAIALPGALLALALVLSQRHYLASLASDSSPRDSGSRTWSGARGAWASWLFGGSAERAGFALAYRVSHRDRVFMRTSYPQLAMPVVMSFFMFRQESGEGPWLFFMLYFTLAVSFAPFLMSVYGEQAAGRELYALLPGAGQPSFRAGLAKGLLLGMILPAMGAIALAGVILRGPTVIPDVLIVLELALLAGLLLGPLAIPREPFRLAVRSSDVNAAMMGWSLACMAAASVLGGVHWYLRSFAHVMPAVASALALSCAWVWFRGRGKSALDNSAPAAPVPIGWRD